MGKKDKKKDKKKGKGAEKTAIKTEKKAALKLKKELALKGEDDIEQLIAKFQEEDKKHQEVVEEKCGPPSLRSSLSVLPHPEKDELLFFGGEYFNGSKTFMYNEFYIYNIKKNQWSLLHCPNSPPPRCAHQAVVVSHGGGQMWIFGGEFASPTRSQFYHYRDLWVYHLSERRWEQIKATHSPSSRSGHRMIAHKKQLILFGGFHETYGDCKYYNDVYVFNIENYQWKKIEPVGNAPSPRSGCQMAVTSEGKVVIYGGYSRQKVKKELEQGTIHTDMFILQTEVKDGSNEKWKWIQVKQSGIKPSPRCGFAFASAPGNRLFAFGGVYDEEENDEMLVGKFYNDLFMLDLEKGRWLPIELHGKKESEKKSRRRQKVSDDDDDTADIEKIENLNIEEEKCSETQTVSDDGVFTVTIGAASTSKPNDAKFEEENEDCKKPFLPLPRMNACLVVKHGILYLFGGMYESGDKRITLADLYSLDIHKLDEWHTTVPPNLTQEWLDSESEESENEGVCGGDDDDDETGESEESDMEVS
ncbi:kelch domain-containing protein 4 [Centruroides vittatus]|uniref:kelch domain-containing protein 4 n=1 Tax=Centruroides vittatus TaxID=120091 RepID=UPI003510475B